MKGYPKYKDSGVEWIGEIPRHWDYINLDYTKSNDRYSFTGGPFGSDLKHNEYTKKGVRIIQLQNIGVGEFLNDYKIFTSETKADQLSSCNIFPNDIIIAKMADPVARACKIPTVDRRYLMASDGIRLKVNSNYHTDFLVYSLNSNYFKYQAELNGTGTTRLRIGLGILKKLKVLSPPLEEQTAIANFLDHKTAQIDEYITKRKQLIELLHEQRKAIINEAVTKGINPNVKMKDSGIEWIGEIPVHWEMKKLKYCSTFLGGYAFSSSDFTEQGIQLIKIGNLYQNKLSLERSPTFLPERFINEYSDYVVTKNDILMSLTGTLGKRDYGYAILLNENSNYLLNQRVGKLTFNSNIKTEYAIHLLQSESYLNQLFLLPSGTKQGNFNGEQILSIKMGIPNLHEQEQILKYVESKLAILVGEIKSTQKEINLLEEYRQSLITEAVTGKIDVRDYKLN